jgi:hypothetical protein
MAILQAGAGTGTAFMQSYQYSAYQPGKSQLIFVTGLVDTAVAGATKDWGYFDANNGIFFRQNGTDGLQVVRRTSTNGSIVNNAVTQGSWNLDNLDGTGSSGYDLNIANVFILVIDLQFLGMGRVRIGFDIDGHIAWAHEFLNANNIAVPYMQMATLPVQALLTTTATATTATMYFKCGAVNSEGGFQEDRGYKFSTPYMAAISAASGARTHILSLRPALTFNGLTNRSQLVLEEVDVYVSGNQPVFWELMVGCTIDSANFTAVDATYSAFAYDITGTYNTGGVVIASGFIASTATAKGSVSSVLGLKYPITLNRAGAVRNLGTVSLCARGIGGGSNTQGTFTFREIR